MKKYVILGALWRDEPNGNTYHNTKILDTDTGATYYTGYKYGYGNAYAYDAKEYIENVLKQNNYFVYDLGAFRLNKLKVKQGNF